MEKEKFKLTVMSVMATAISSAKSVVAVAKYIAKNAMAEEECIVIGAMEQEDTEGAFIVQVQDTVIAGLTVFFAKEQDKANASHAMEGDMSPVITVMEMVC